MTIQNTLPYRVLLYYKYVHIENPEIFTKHHRKFCEKLGIKGRILIATEGINGTLSGTISQTEEYIHTMHNDSRFADMIFKIDEVENHQFKKLYVREKKELVTFRVQEEIDPNVITGKRLSPKEFLETMQQEDVVILDGRTGYEYDLGHFRNAVRPNIKSFREFPEWIREKFSEHKNKKVLTYCTGGIRCEKLSGFLLKEGFNNVYQLDGGIVTYGKDEEVRGKFFDGKCYVFDERKSVPINQIENVIVSQCQFCGNLCDRYVNCANIDCHTQFFCCEHCEQETMRSCSKQCETAKRHEVRESITS